MAASPRRGAPGAPAVLYAHASAELYGADRTLLELLSGLRDKGLDAQVVLPWDGPLKAQVQALGVPVHVKNLAVLRRRYMNPLGLLNRACRLWSAVRLLLRLIRQHHIDVLHSNTTAVFSGALAAKLAGVPHVWHVHEITTRPLWFARLIAQAVGRLTHTAVFVSHASLEHMCALNPRVRSKAMVIHNGIDGGRAQGGQRGVLRAEHGWTDAHAIVGMVGRINWWKGQGKLLDCAAILATTHPAARFVMVGGTFDGDRLQRDGLLARIAAAGLQDRVVVVDFRADIGNVLADLDVFVLPSTEPEPFGLVVLEAMAASLPVVAFGHGGVCEIVEPGSTGLLVPPCDASAMAVALASLLDDPARGRAMGQAGRVRLERQFTRQAYIDRFAALYRELAQAKRST